MDTILEKVKLFAEEAHGAQQRKFSGEPYIRHLIRVAEICAEYTDDTVILSAALLHDVLEDTDVTESNMTAFLRSVLNEEDTIRTIRLVVELTDVYIKKNFPQLNRKTRKNMETIRLAVVSQDAQTIKYADIIDNAIDIASHDTDFSKVYLKEAMMLLERMGNGHPALRERAGHVVKDCLLRIRSGLSHR